MAIQELSGICTESSLPPYSGLAVCAFFSQINSELFSVLFYCQSLSVYMNEPQALVLDIIATVFEKCQNSVALKPIFDF